MFRLLILLALLSIYKPSLAQASSTDTNFVYWSENRKLIADDFQIKKSNSTSSYHVQSGISYRVKSISIWNGKHTFEVRNYITRTASWIIVDTTWEVSDIIQHAQTLFDLAEVYARRLRKEFKINSRKLNANQDLANELYNQNATELSKRQAHYVEDWATENQKEAQKQWEEQIKKELAELKEYAY